MSTHESREVVLPNRKAPSVIHLSLALTISALVAVGPAVAKEPKYKADVPASIMTLDTVETERLGTLKIFDGMPDKETVKKVYDNLDFSRGVEAFLSGMPAASLYAICSGFEKAGIPAHTVGVSEELLDARSLLLTPNSTTVYVMTCLDLKQGPVVMEVAPGLLGGVNDAFFRWVTDIGVTGPDQGRGGRYLYCAAAMNSEKASHQTRTFEYASRSTPAGMSRTNPLNVLTWPMSWLSALIGRNSSSCSTNSGTR